MRIQRYSTQIVIAITAGAFIIAAWAVIPMTRAKASLEPTTALACVTAPNGLISWWRAEGDALDARGSNDGSQEGGVAYGPGEVGQAFDLNGTNQRILIGNPANMQLQDLTIDLWVQRASTTVVSNNPAGPLQLAAFLSYGTNGYGFGIKPDGTILLTKVGVSGTDSVGAKITDTALHHIAVTKSGSTVTFYVDGVPSAGTAGAYEPGFAFSSNAYIGFFGSGGGEFLGKLDEIDVFNRGLTTAEIQSIYTAGPSGKCFQECTPQPPTGQTSWWHGEGNADDSAGTNNGTLVGGTSYAAGRVGQGFNLNGSNAGVTIPHNTNLDVNPGGFSTEFWMKANSQGYMIPIDKSHGFVDSAGWLFQSNPEGTRIDFAIGAGGGATTNFVGVASTANPFDGNFHHIAGTWDGSNVRLYIDGVLQGTTAFTAPVNNTRPVNIGYSWGGGSPQRYFNGVVDEVAIYQRALTETEIRASAGNCNCGPEDLTNWWPADGNTADTVGTRDGTIIGSVPYAPGVVGEAFSVSGTGSDYVTVPAAASGTQITIDAWVNPSTLTGGFVDPSLPGVTRRTAAGSADNCNDLTIGLFGGRLGALYRTPSGCIGLLDAEDITVQTNQWYHIAVTIDGATAKLYVNGVLRESGATAANYVPSPSFNIGRASCCTTDSFGGLVDEVHLFGRPLSSDEIASIYTAGSAGISCSTAGCATAAGSIAGWFKAEGNANDQLGTNNATNNGATFAAGKVGQAFSFNGAPGVNVNAGTTLGSVGTGDVAVEFWMQTSTNRQEQIVSKRGGCTGGGEPAYYSVRTLATGALHVEMDNGVGQRVAFNSTGPVTDGTFHHVTLQRAGNTMELYIDGVLNNSAAGVAGINFGNVAPFAIGGLGCSGVDGTQPFTGLLDEVTVYNGSLTAQQIQAIVAAGAAGKCPLAGPTPTATATATATPIAGAPSASGVLNGVISSGQTFTGVTITYTDNTAIDVSTIGNGDIHVTGPNGFNATGGLTTLDNPTNGSPRVAGYLVGSPGGSWDPADNGTYNIVMQANEVSDTSGQFVPAGVIGTFEVNLVVNQAPTAAASTTAPVPGQASVAIVATYTDEVAINASTIGQGDIRVTGPNGFDAAPVFAGQSPPENSPQHQAVYGLAAPGGTWDPADNGTYTIVMQANEVADTGGVFVAAGTIGSLVVNINEAPTGTATSPSAQPGTMVQAIVGTYTDETAINASTIGAGDLRVTGPNGFDAAVSFEGQSPPTNSPQHQAVYGFVPPGGSWDAADNGVYSFVMQPNEVADTGGLFIAAGVIGTLTVNITEPGATRFDYDGDGRTDISVFRPSSGAWYLSQSTAGIYGTLFGDLTDRVAPADYDGDGRTDIAVYRPSTGIWYVLNSSTGTFSYTLFGISEDLPTPGDYDADGKADIAVYRPSTSIFYRTDSSNGSFHGVQFGQVGDRPTIDDYDGDGKSDVGIYRPSDSTWYQLNSADGTFFGELFGATGDRIAPGDYDGDGKADIAVYRPSESLWVIRRSSTATYDFIVFGIAEDIPAVGDYDGDGKADIAVFRPSTGYWYSLNSSDGAFISFQWGESGDIPTPDAFNN